VERSQKTSCVVRLSRPASHVRYIASIARLTEDGLVSQQPYRGVFLTPMGQRLAAEARDRHRVVEAFLVALGVSADTARRDAEGIEHHVSAETLDAFRAFARLHAK